MHRTTASKQSQQRYASQRLTSAEASSSALDLARSASPYLTEAEAADYMRLKPSTLTKWRSIGRGPRFTKAGRLIVYRLTDLEGWLEKRASGGDDQ